MLEEEELRNKLHFLFTWLPLRALCVTQQRYLRKQKESTSFTRHIYTDELLWNTKKQREDTNNAYIIYPRRSVMNGSRREGKIY